MSGTEVRGFVCMSLVCIIVFDVLLRVVGDVERSQKTSTTFHCVELMGSVSRSLPYRQV